MLYIFIMNTSYSITAKNQVTIPKHIRKVLGITDRGEVQFVRDGSRVYVQRADTVSDVQARNKRLLNKKGRKTVSDSDIANARQQFHQDNLSW